MFEAARWVGGFIFEIKVNLRQVRQVQLDEVSVGGTVKISLNFLNGLVDPMTWHNSKTIAGVRNNLWAIRKSLRTPT